MVAIMLIFLIRSDHRPLLRVGPRLHLRREPVLELRGNHLSAIIIIIIIFIIMITVSIIIIAAIITAFIISLVLIK